MSTSENIAAVDKSAEAEIPDADLTMVAGGTLQSPANLTFNDTPITDVRTK